MLLRVKNNILFQNKEKCKYLFFYRPLGSVSDLFDIVVFKKLSSLVLVSLYVTLTYMNTSICR